MELGSTFDEPARVARVRASFERIGAAPDTARVDGIRTAVP
jgi:hypothetical protein